MDVTAHEVEIDLITSAVQDAMYWAEAVVRAETFGGVLEAQLDDRRAKLADAISRIADLFDIPEDDETRIAFSTAWHRQTKDAAVRKLEGALL